MRYINFLLLMLHCLTGHAQIQFDVYSSDMDLKHKASQADSAIRANEFGEVHSLIVIKNGHLVFENYYHGWTRDSVHQLQSATKSVIATLLGCAIQQGFVSSEEDLISMYYPDYDFSDPLKKQIRIIDLLTQRHGLDWNEGAWEDPNNTWRKVLSEPGDWYRKILDTPMDTLPGNKFLYSNAAPTLVSGLIQKASGLSIDSFAIRNLFEPLGIQDYWFWPGNGGPQNNGMALISLRSRDLAKIGQLYLQDGYWDQKIIISDVFIKKASSSIVLGVEMNGLYKQYDYGYFWWRNPVTHGGKKSEIYLARGAGGQNLIVNPDQNVVVVITAWNLQRPNLPQMIYDRYLSE